MCVCRRQWDVVHDIPEQYQTLLTHYRYSILHDSHNARLMYMIREMNSDTIISTLYVKCAKGAFRRCLFSIHTYTQKWSPHTTPVWWAGAGDFYFGDLNAKSIPQQNSNGPSAWFGFSVLYSPKRVSSKLKEFNACAVPYFMVLASVAKKHGLFHSTLNYANLLSKVKQHTHTHIVGNTRCVIVCMVYRFKETFHLPQCKHEGI